MALRAGRRRRNDLLDAIAGVSDKVLTQTLRRLHTNGLIARIAAPADRSVTYELSGLGRSLADGPLAALGHWAVEHADQLLAAQENPGRPPQDTTSLPRKCRNARAKSTSA
ncbi:transcriptional regulator [Streptomyces griseocarneus]|nr:transcriptional regulator [Streptomyces griseocarneus]